MTPDERRHSAAEACQTAAELFLIDKPVDARKQLMKALYASDRMRAEAHKKRTRKLPTGEIGSEL